MSTVFLNYRRSVWQLVLGGVLLVVVLGAGVAYLDSPGIISGIVISVVCVSFIWQRLHLLIVLMILSSQIKDVEAVAQFIPNIGIDLTVLIALIIYLVLGAQLVINFDVVEKALSRQFLPIVLFMLFLLVLVISTFYPLSNAYGFDKILRFATLSSLTFIAPMLLLRSFQDLKDILIAFIFIGLLFAIFVQPDLDVSSGRLISLGSNTIFLGVFAASALIILVWWNIPASSNMLIRGLLLIMSMPLVTTLLGTGSRGPLMSIIVTAGLLFLLSSIYGGGLRQAFTVITFLLLVALIIWLSWPQLSADAQQRIDALANPVATVEGDSRSDLWRAGLDNFVDNPVFGMGAGGFGRNNIIAAKRIILWPHNIVLEVAAEQGLVGLIPLLSLLGSTLYVAFRSMKIAFRNGMQLYMAQTVFALLVFQLLNAMVANDLNDNRLLWLFAGVTWWFYTTVVKDSQDITYPNMFRRSRITSQQGFV